MVLSILICTLPERKHYLDRLLSILNPQITNGVEIVINDSGRQMPTGTKRNLLIDSAQGEYVGFVDCDDIVSNDYVSLIKEGALSGKDVVTFNGKMTTNGASPVDWVIKLGEDYVERNGMYYRFPNHLTYMKKSLIKGVKFPDVWMGEDYAFAKKVNDLGLLKSDYHIEKQLYTYEYRTNK
jgi:glycosyltransferase involved in cell wall biosynthesis